VTKSSTEAELVALTDGCTDVLWLRNLLLAQGYDIGPVAVGEDNQSVLAMFEKRSVGLARTRHINVRYFFVVDRVGSGELKITYVPTQEMVADCMTKPLMGKAFGKLRAMLMGNGHDRDP
jgi:hypothetical protein